MRAGAVAALGLTLANCGKSTGVDSKYGVSASPRVVAAGQPVPKGGGRYSVGRPYQIAGRTYVPQENPDYSAVGIASWYGDDFHGRKTANGEVFDMNSIAAAHPTLPLPSYVRVTNLRNKRSLIVRVNDRGPFHEDRVIDLSARAADLLGFQGHGIARVRVDYVGRASLDGSDDMKLAATLRHDGRPAAAPGSAPAQTRIASSRPFAREYFDPTPMVAPASAATGPDPRRETPQTRMAVASAAPSVPAPPAARPAPADGPRLASVESRPVPPPQSRALPQAPSQAQPRMVWSQGPQPASFDSRFGNAPAPSAPQGPAAAYAPARHDGALVTGRGLY